MTGPRGQTPRRVRVTHPRTDASRRVPARPAIREIDEQTRIGEVYMTALIRSQRRLALVTCGFTALLLGGIALLGGLVPAYGRLRVWGLPLCWLLLGVLVYPVLIGLARFSVRQAERNERDFAELLRDR
jgi:hypothetical protein